MNRLSSRRLSSIFISVTTVISLSGIVGVVAPIAHAQSVADLQAQIAALQASLAKTKMSGGGAMMSASSISRNLTVGSRGDDVSALQSVLNSKGYLKVSPTGFFGGLTKKAVMMWQKDAGLPNSGFFGPLSRAAWNSMAVMPTTPVVPVVPGTPPVVVAVPGSGLSVSVASDNPPTGALISSSSSAAARVGVLKFNLTASNAAAVVVSQLTFTRSGVLSDSSVSSAYLVENGQVIQQYTSLSQGRLVFTGMNLTVNAGQTRSLTLAIDPATGLTAGNTVAFNLDSKDVMVMAGVPVSGSAVMGNVFTITSVSNPSIASLTIASASVGTSVYAGTQNVLVSQWTLTTNNNPVTLRSINFKVIGSANKTDLKNVKLYINGSQVGATLPMVMADGTAFFDMSANPPRVNTGSGNMQVYADVMGSPSYTYQFELLNTYDVFAVDTQYNTGVAVTINGGSGVSVTINQGQITVTTSSDTPTTNVAKGGSGTTLAKFVIYAAGEAVKVKFLDFRLAFTGTTLGLSTMVKNISLVDDTGLQVGTTINTPPTTNTCGVATAGYNGAGSQYNDCFGTTTSPINYIVPANTARTLSLIGDIQTGATFTTITGSLLAMSSNLQGLSSSQTASSGAASGAALTLATTPLSVTLNGALGAPTYAKGTSQARIGSYTLTASSAEAVNISNLTITFAASATSTQNAVVKIGSTQFGTTKATLSGSDIVTYSGSPIVVPKGGSVNLDVYADILSNASSATYTTLTTLTSCTGTGAITNSSVSCSPTAVAGQSPVVSSGPTVTVTADQSTQLAGQMVMGSTGNSLVTFKFTDTANIEPIKITDLTMTDDVSTLSGTTTNTKASFTNLTLWQGNTLVGGPVTMQDGTGILANSYKGVYSFAPPLVVPQNGTLVLQLKGDVASYTSNGSSDNRIHIWKVQGATQVSAIGQQSNTSATATVASATGNQLTVLRSKLTISGATLGTTSARTRSAVDDIATLTFTADPAGDVNVNTITLKFQGAAVSGSTVSTVRLLSGGTDWNGLSSAGGSCTGGTGNSCTVTFNFAASTASTTISAGTSKTVTVRIDSSGLANVANSQDSLSILIANNATTTLDWGDVGITNFANTTTTGLSLEAKAVPLTVSSVSYE